MVVTGPSCAVVLDEVCGGRRRFGRKDADLVYLSGIGALVGPGRRLGDLNINVSPRLTRAPPQEVQRSGPYPGPVGASLAARERILDTASGALTPGVHGVRVGAVVAASGVAKAALYKHFPRKDDVVLSYP